MCLIDILWGELAALLTLIKKKTLGYDLFKTNPSILFLRTNLEYLIYLF